MADSLSGCPFCELDEPAVTVYRDATVQGFIRRRPYQYGTQPGRTLEAAPHPAVPRRPCRNSMESSARSWSGREGRPRGGDSARIERTVDRRCPVQSWLGRSCVCAMLCGEGRDDTRSVDQDFRVGSRKDVAHAPWRHTAAYLRGRASSKGRSRGCGISSEN